jgi:hypothetical protein
VAPLQEGARLHCFVDACKGVFALGLPSRTYTRADGWSAWEVPAPQLISIFTHTPCIFNHHCVLLFQGLVDLHSSIC